MNPIVSVIIPCFNQAKFLPDAVNSVLGQTLQNLECIIINDGSSDDTQNVALQLASKDRRIRYFSQKNRGLSGARNVGLEKARGLYIQFLDSDDSIESEKLEVQVAALSDLSELALCYSDYRHCPEDDLRQTVKRDNFLPPRFKEKSPLHDIASRWETEFSIPVHSFLFDARFFNDHGIRFDENLRNHEDWDCWMQIFALSPIVKLTPGQMAIYRIYNSSMSTAHDQMRQGFEQALRKQLIIFGEDPIMRGILINKIREINHIHRRHRLGNKVAGLHRNLRRLYAGIVPWPVQRFISRLSRSISGRPTSS